LPPLREVIAVHGLAPRKSLGQHFLHDLNLTRRIARAAGDLSRSVVIEIGPGPGGLTRALLEAGASRVVAIERDRRFLEPLAELGSAFPGRLATVAHDALHVDIGELARTQAPPDAGSPTEIEIKVVANLPYNVATPVLISLLRRASAFTQLVLMFQKEVAERLVAAPGTAQYGRLSIIVQWLCRVERLFDVPRQAFVPPPKVTSSVMRLTPLPAPAAPAEMADLEKVTAAAFGQRRKMLRAALRSLTPTPLDLLAEAGVPPTARAEQLSVAEFCALARAYAKRRS
jgi:16S rRNA (adenine1518-N6/adenine1519-N6)-dimethyltransferase